MFWWTVPPFVRLDYFLLWLYYSVQVPICQYYFTHFYILFVNF